MIVGCPDLPQGCVQQWTVWSESCPGRSQEFYTWGFFSPLKSVCTDRLVQYESFFFEPRCDPGNRYLVLLRTGVYFKGTLNTNESCVLNNRSTEYWFKLWWHPPPTIPEMILGVDMTIQAKCNYWCTPSWRNLIIKIVLILSFVAIASVIRSYLTTLWACSVNRAKHWHHGDFRTIMWGTNVLWEPIWLPLTFVRGNKHKFNAAGPYPNFL